MAHIVLIEDSGSLRELLTLSLKRVGHVVRDAAGAREGMALCRAWSPDIVITDLCVPHAEALDALFDAPPLVRPAIIVITGMSNAGCLDHLPLFAVLTKPFHNETLIRLVAQAAPSSRRVA